MRNAGTRPSAAVLASEREFHDRRFVDGDSRVDQLKYYWAISRGAERYADMVKQLAAGAEVLEYGCGAEALAPQLAASARSVLAIDISEQAIARAREQSPSSAVTYTVMNAMDLAYESASFDLVCGSGIVHHLDTAVCAREVSRVLRPTGHAVFWEPLGLNPIINAYRLLTPGARTPDEHPLLPRDVRILRGHFSCVDLQFFGLTSLAAVPFRAQSGGLRLRTALDGIDEALFRLPGVRYLAWYALIRCAK
jgi:SAM-dependent methyltransferase